MSGKSCIIDSFKNSYLSSLQATVLYYCEKIPKYEVEFTMSNKLRYALPLERLSKINLLCKQNSCRIKDFNGPTTLLARLL